MAFPRWTIDFVFSHLLRGNCRRWNSRKDSVATNAKESLLYRDYGGILRLPRCGAIVPKQPGRYPTPTLWFFRHWSWSRGFDKPSVGLRHWCLGSSTKTPGAHHRARWVPTADPPSVHRYAGCSVLLRVSRVSKKDIFALGVILQEMLSGEGVFEGSSTVEVLNATLKNEPSSAADLRFALQTFLRSSVFAVTSEEWCWHRSA